MDTLYRYAVLPSKDDALDNAELFDNHTEAQEEAQAIYGVVIEIQYDFVDSEIDDDGFGLDVTGGAVRADLHYSYTDSELINDYTRKYGLGDRVVFSCVTNGPSGLIEAEHTGVIDEFSGNGYTVFFAEGIDGCQYWDCNEDELRPAALSVEVTQEQFDELLRPTITIEGLRLKNGTLPLGHIAELVSPLGKRLRVKVICIGGDSSGDITNIDVQVIEEE